MAILDVLKKVFAPRGGKKYNDSSVFRGNLSAVDAKTGMPVMSQKSVESARKSLGDPYSMSPSQRAAKQKAIFEEGQKARTALGGRDFSSRPPEGAAKKAAVTMAASGKLYDFPGQSKVPAIKSFYEDK